MNPQTLGSAARFVLKHALRIVLLLYTVVFLREQAWMSFGAAVLLVAIAMLDQTQVPFLTMKRRVMLGIVLFIITVLVSPAFLSGTAA